MSQSSPEGIILGKGSKLVSLDLSINEEMVLSMREKEILYTKEDVLGFGNFCIKEIADFLDGKGDQTDGQEITIEELFEQFKNK
jgi:hypothetical protein